MGLFYKIKKAVIQWFGNILIYPYPFFINFGHTAYKMKGEDVRDVLNTIQPGDILLRRYNNYISGLMIPGYYTHSAIYMGNNKIIHMLGDGIEKQDILTFCRCDSVVIIHCNEEQISKGAIKKARDLYIEGVEYDFGFDFSDKTRHSCTEAVSYFYNDPKMDKKKDNYIMPDDFLSIDKSLFTISYQKGK
jgi:hypothetical protein